MAATRKISNKFNEDDAVSYTVNFKPKAKNDGITNRSDDENVAEDVQTSISVKKIENETVESLCILESIPNLEEIDIHGDGQTLTIRKYIWVDVS